MEKRKIMFNERVKFVEKIFEKVKLKGFFSFACSTWGVYCQ